MILNEKKLNEIIKKVLKESRFIFGDYKDDQGNSTDLKAVNISKKLGKQSNPHERWTNQDEREQIIDEVYSLAGPDVFISFVDPFEKGADGYLASPAFSLNPNATFNTPHGIYAYPFDKNDAQRFIETGSPTPSPFATGRKYFHLMRIDLANPNIIVFNKDGTCNRNISNQEYEANIDEMIRMHYLFFKDEIMNCVMKYDREYWPRGVNKQTDKNKNVKIVIDEYYFKDSKKEELQKFLNSLRSSTRSMYIDNNYYRLYKAAYHLSKNKYMGDSSSDVNIDANLNVKFSKTREVNSEFFTLLLNRIGIKCVIDKGTGAIHPNEPSQVHILTLADDSSYYEYLGTYHNNLTASDELFYYFLKNNLSVNKKFIAIDKDKKIFVCDITNAEAKLVTSVEQYMVEHPEDFGHHKINNDVDVDVDVENEYSNDPDVIPLIDEWDDEDYEDYIETFGIKPTRMTKNLEKKFKKENYQELYTFFTTELGYPPIFIPVDWKEISSKLKVPLLVSFEKKVKISAISGLTFLLKKIAKKYFGYEKVSNSSDSNDDDF